MSQISRKRGRVTIEVEKATSSLARISSRLDCGLFPSHFAITQHNPACDPTADFSRSHSEVRAAVCVEEDGTGLQVLRASIETIGSLGIAQQKGKIGIRSCGGAGGGMAA